MVFATYGGGHRREEGCFLSALGTGISSPPQNYDYHLFSVVVLCIFISLPRRFDLVVRPGSY